MLLISLVLLSSFLINAFTIVFYTRKLKIETSSLKEEINELKDNLKKERSINYQLMKHSD